MESSDIWLWMWLIAAVAFVVGEMLTFGSFFLLPFAGGAAVAFILSIFGVNPAIGFAAFLIVSGAGFAALRPLSRRLDAEESSDGIGAKRLIGGEGAVLEMIPGGDDLGLVRVGREKWRAESADRTALAEGTPIRVLEVRGTRVVVWPTNRPGQPPLVPPSDAGSAG